ncbi:MAG: hypothetical protein NZO16_06355 [Deltaproteobacteria bacterium]|nr:hypothetical protein [Deltaproteobacteria bacterium]
MLYLHKNWDKQEYKVDGNEEAANVSIFLQCLAKIYRKEYKNTTVRQIEKIVDCKDIKRRLKRETGGSQARPCKSMVKLLMLEQSQKFSNHGTEKELRARINFLILSYF